MTIPVELERVSPSIGLPELVAAAVAGRQAAWAGLVERFAPLISSVIRRYRLAPSDAGDVRQTVWLRLVEHIEDLREPLALPGWIATTTRNEAQRVLSARQRIHLVDPQVQSRRLERPSHVDLDENLVRLETQAAVHAGLNELRPEHRDLLTLLFADPELSYQQISQQLGIPTGSIGPTRARGLQKLHATTPIRLLAS
jgi:RNA polymerase sigma factor (sigma-70 family)